MKYHIAALVSFWYYRKENDLVRVREAADQGVRNGNHVSVMVDSGAFSADTQGHTITVTEYAQWLTDLARPILGPHMTVALNLDVLRDSTASMRNWQRLRDQGHPTIPVTHLGDSATVLDAYAQHGVDYIALGAMVGRSVARKMRWAAHIHRHVHDHHPHVRLHGLGVGGQKLVEALPWYSVDSSGFGSAYRYGALTLYDPIRRAFVRLRVSDKRTLHALGRMLRTHYGVTPAQLYTRTEDNAVHRRIVLGVITRSILHWQASLQARRPVTPPASQRATGPLIHYALANGAEEERGVLPGPIIHFVDGSITHVQQHLEHPA